MLWLSEMPFCFNCICMISASVTIANPHAPNHTSNYSSAKAIALFSWLNLNLCHFTWNQRSLWTWFPIVAISSDISHIPSLFCLLLLTEKLLLMINLTLCSIPTTSKLGTRICFPTTYTPDCELGISPTCIPTLSTPDGEVGISPTYIPTISTPDDIQ